MTGMIPLSIMRVGIRHRGGLTSRALHGPDIMACCALCHERSVAVQAAARIAPVAVPPQLSDGKPWNGAPMGSAAASADGTGTSAMVHASTAASRQQKGGAADASPAVMPCDGDGHEPYSGQQQPQLPS